MNLYMVTTCEFRGEPEPHGVVHKIESCNYATRVCVIDAAATLADDIINGGRFRILPKKGGRILVSGKDDISPGVTYGIEIKKIDLRALPIKEYLKLRLYYMRYSVLMSCLAYHTNPDPRLATGRQKVK